MKLLNKVSDVNREKTRKHRLYCNKRKLLKKIRQSSNSWLNRYTFSTQNKQTKTVERSVMTIIFVKRPNTVKFYKNQNFPLFTWLFQIFLISSNFFSLKKLLFYNNLKLSWLFSSLNITILPSQNSESQQLYSETDEFIECMVERKWQLIKKHL